MSKALEAAHMAFQNNEVPVGAVIVSSEGKVLATAFNMIRQLNDPTAHAEILAIRKACEALGTDRLEGCSIYVTLEPCSMCASAISLARIAKLYFGAIDNKSGGVENGARIYTLPQTHHKPEIFGGIMARECGEILTTFFSLKRDNDQSRTN
ncbi:MAG: nucleoside deaminase [Paracoccaceae bacterium]|nr:nucleoside deaminase [Paracoccaceae bacterium]MDE2917791.1 nucleoside deaminase [Paracoccaceae bacterium]